ncbi:hypothetical protein K474DRAFT_1404992 [Panus rudis PR-1116 ss-1]|nr:hypothetical protein K474DRAFT_1404992 [Panus rudis PR-1116 ss-1]
MPLSLRSFRLGGASDSASVTNPKASGSCSRRRRPTTSADPVEEWQLELEESRARLASFHIDAAIKGESREQRKASRTRGKEVKILLLGQEEGGRCTFVKHLEMLDSDVRVQWDRERNSWKAVIHLNIVDTLLTVLHVLRKELAVSSGTSSPCSLAAAQSVHDLYTPLLEISTALEEHAQTSKTSSITQSRTAIQQATDHLVSLKSNIKALWDDHSVHHILHKWRVRVEDGPGFFLDHSDLSRILTDTYVPTDQDILRAHRQTDAVRASDGRLHQRARGGTVREHRFRLSNFSSTFSLGKGTEEGMSITSDSDPRTSHRTEWILYDLRPFLNSRHVWPPYFDNIDLIFFLAPIHCFDERLPSLSSSPSSRSLSSNVLLTDHQSVRSMRTDPGSRSTHHDHMGSGRRNRTSPRKNRLEDSLDLWNEVCSSQLLQNIPIVLFLNKTDILERKLSKDNVKVSDYVPRYGDRPNEVNSVVKYFRTVFEGVFTIHSPRTRSRNDRDGRSRWLRVFATSLIDVGSTRAVLSEVCEMLHQRNTRMEGVEMI